MITSVLSIIKSYRNMWYYTDMRDLCRIGIKVVN